MPIELKVFCTGIVLALIIAYLIVLSKRFILIKRSKYLYNVGVIRNINNNSISLFNIFTKQFEINYCIDTFKNINNIKTIEFRGLYLVRWRDYSYKYMKIAEFKLDLKKIYNEVKSNELIYYLITKYMYDEHKLIKMLVEDSKLIFNDQYYVGVAERLEKIITDEDDRAVLLEYLDDIKETVYDPNKGISERRASKYRTPQKSKVDSDSDGYNIINQYIKKE